jgi:hypothetical protein
MRSGFRAFVVLGRALKTDHRKNAQEAICLCFLLIGPVVISGWARWVCRSRHVHGELWGGVDGCLRIVLRCLGGCSVSSVYG